MTNWQEIKAVVLYCTYLIMIVANIRILTQIDRTNVSIANAGKDVRTPFKRPVGGSKNIKGVVGMVWETTIAPILLTII